MISDEKPQNIIMIVTLLVGIISATSLVNSTAYYTGTIYMVRYLDIELEEIRINGIDLDNRSTDISMKLVFNFQVPEGYDGRVRLTTIASEVILNSDELSYTVFRKYIPAENGWLTPDYNRNFTISAVLDSPIDRNTLYNATVDESWNFSVVFRYFYLTFGSTADDVNIRLYNSTTITFT